MKVGVTGGIGSGKTTVCKLFETLGVPIYYADSRAKWLMANDPQVREQLVTTFGAETFTDGVLNRPYLSSVVFSNPDKLAELNAIVHPAVFRDGADWETKHTDFPYTIKEAALMFETGSYRLLDKIIVVTAPIHVRVERVVQRDATTEQAVRERIENQLPDEQKIAHAHFVIVNDGEQPLIPQVMKIHKELMQHSF